MNYWECYPTFNKGTSSEKKGDNLVYLNRAVETWIDLKDFQPDETKVVEIEELLDLNNGVLFQSLNEQIESNHYNILSDLAAASFNGTQSDNEDEGTSHVEDDDDDSPRNCVLYGQGKCL